MVPTENRHNNNEAPQNKAFSMEDFLHKVQDAFEGFSVKVFTKTTKEKGFDFIDTMNNNKGPIVEIGGPTDNTEFYRTVGITPTTFRGINKIPIITNLNRYEVFYKDTPQEIIHENIIDAQIDATHMPFENGSVGTIMAANLNVHAGYADVAKEANRVLQPEGLLIWANVLETEIPEILKDTNFKIKVDAQHRLYPQLHSIVLQKTTSE